MLKTIQYYAPLTSTISNWWFGSSRRRKSEDNEVGNDEQDNIPQSSEEEEEEDAEHENDNFNKKRSIVATTDDSEIDFQPNEETHAAELNGKIHESDDVDLLLKNRKLSIPKIEGKWMIDSFNQTVQFPLSSDDEYRTCNETATVNDYSNSTVGGRLLNSNYQLDDQVRQIILKGLSETNDEEDDLPSRRWSRQQSSSSSFLNNRRQSINSLAPHHSSSAGLGSSRDKVQDLVIRNIQHIPEYTDSDSSFLEASSKNKSTKNDKPKPSKNKNASGILFPFSLIFNNKNSNRNSSKTKKNNLSPKKRWRTATASAASSDEQTLILRVKTKSYGTSEYEERTLFYNSGNRARIRSIQRTRDAVEITSNEDSDYPVATVNPDFLSASYSQSADHHHDNRKQRRKSLSESSMQLSYCSLNSSWSEYTISLPSTEVGSECKENGYDDDDNDDDELSTTTTTTTTVPKDKHDTAADVRHKAASQRTYYLTGNHVKEIFMDDECFCCQCTIM